MDTDQILSFGSICLVCRINQFQDHVSAYTKTELSLHWMCHSSPYTPTPTYPPHTGSVYVRSQLRPLLTAWRASFPRSTKEMNAELATGTLTSWLITLENRAGALSSECVLICLFIGGAGTLEFKVVLDSIR